MMPFLAGEFFNTPLAIHPVRGMQIARALGGSMTAPLAFDWGPGFTFGAESAALDYDLIDGVAIIEASGYLVQRAAGMPANAGCVGCDEISRVFAETLDDRRVKAIALVINSIGGEVGGCLDLSDQIFESRAKKPIAAILDDSAYGSAYVIASACEQVMVPRTGGAGSVGIAVMHMDTSRALGNAGLDVTLIQYGDHKADANQFAPLSEGAFARFQADIDVIGELFVSTVARNRGISPDAVRAQQAATYLGSHAVDAGLADQVLSSRAAFEELVAVVHASMED